jgi:aerobic-type carbon monoxide dehydrogenase small subunit (CoxS/CutS family)
MKSIFGLVGILLVLAIVGLLAKTQLKSTTTAVSPAAAAAGVSIKTIEGATPAQENQQIQQQVKDKVNAALQAAPKPEDEK